jgi:hypothetical protein
MLALSYLPGALSFGLLAGAFATLSLLLGGARIVWPGAPQPAEGAGSSRGLLIALASALFVGGLLRLTWLGYSEFQGDEARVLLRANDLLLGFRNTPFIHQKPPGEILVTAALYGLVGATTESVARLPFALANLAGLAGVLLLGRRLLGPVGGLAAALVLAVDGYLIAFGRILQYQSLVFLCVVTALLLLAGAVEQQRHATAAGGAPAQLHGRLVAVAMVAAGGLLFHYEMAAVALPALWLLWQIQREGVSWSKLGRLLLLPLMVGTAMVLLFYLPFVRHAEFPRAFAYVVGDRLGHGAPYNNLHPVLQRSMLYSSSYAVLLQALAVVVGAAMLVARGWKRRGAVLAGALTALAMILVLALAVAQPAWATVGGRDLSALPLAMAFIAVPLLPALTVGERTVWLWFGPLAALALVAVAVPHSHVYTFFIPLALVTGATLQAIDDVVVRRRRSASAVRRAGAAMAIVALALLAIYPFLMFADAPAERLRRWEVAQPAPFWYPFEQPSDLAIFGFPLRNGWKAVGALYGDGTLVEGFESNARPEVADWYTRGFDACPSPERLWFLAETVEPTDDAALDELAAALDSSMDRMGAVQVAGVDRLQLFAARDGGPAPRLTPTLEESEAAFDASTRTLIERRRGRISAAQAATPLEIPFADGLRLTGYTLRTPQVAPGGAVDLTLEWEALRPMSASYTVFLHVVNEPGGDKVGQRDALPVCGRAETWLWAAGDRIADPHRIEISPDAPPGRYRLLVGLYTLEDGARLTVLDAAGMPAGDYVDLAEIEVLPSVAQRTARP